MRFIQNNTESIEDVINKNENISIIENIENFHYLYPNGHRIPHQLRWFKGSRDRGLQSDKVS